MISVTLQPDTQFKPDLRVGSWGQRFRENFSTHRKRQTLPVWSLNGAGVVQGFIKIGSGGAENCRAILLSEQHAAVLDEAIISAGAYFFQRLPPANYIVAVVDVTGRWRAKAIHTVVPTP